MSSEGIILPSDSSLYYLSNISPRDARFDKYKQQSKIISNLYLEAGLVSYSQKIDECANFLGFNTITDESTGEVKLKLSQAWFCKCRHCMMCQARRVVMWIKRFKKGIPRLLTDYPNIKFVFLTLTVRNSSVGDLRDTLTWMNTSWRRLTQRNQFPAIGYIKSVELTRSEDGKAHPHFHCLLAVPSSYFVGRLYLSYEKWRQLWRGCLKVDYDPQISVQKVKPKKEVSDPLEAILGGVLETIKYSIKPEDLIAEAEWLAEVTAQLHGMRAVSIGGVFKEYLSDKEPENLISEEEPKEKGEANIIFIWDKSRSKYVSKMKEQ